MRKEIVKILCCPTCKSELNLTVEKEEKGEIITGMFFCSRCHSSYPIVDGIPNLLPQES